MPGRWLQQRGECAQGTGRSCARRGDGSIASSLARRGTATSRPRSAREERSKYGARTSTAALPSSAARRARGGRRSSLVRGVVCGAQLRSLADRAGIPPRTHPSGCRGAGFESGDAIRTSPSATPSSRLRAGRLRRIRAAIESRHAGVRHHAARRDQPGPGSWSTSTTARRLRSSTLVRRHLDVDIGRRGHAACRRRSPTGPRSNDYRDRDLRSCSAHGGLPVLLSSLTTGSPLASKGCTARTTPALELRGLTKRYDDGTLALEDFDLEVPAGAFFGLLGPNGAGKTTLISAVCNLHPDHLGRGLVFGEPHRLAAARAAGSGWPSRTSTSTAS